jgi:N-acetylmuramoyl-L-alanine amidase
MKRFYFFLFVFFLLFSQFSFAKDSYLLVTAEKGDGANSLLRKYSLEGYECNVNQFYLLNKIKVGADLLVGEKYFLPILIVMFDGKSIQSTLHIDVQMAGQIDTYNDNMLAERVRKYSYQSSKVLWVPFHITHKCASKSGLAPKKVNNPPKTSTKEPEKIKSTLSVEKSSGGKRIFSIFGTDYQQVNLIDRKLKNQVYYIDAGHGGPDPGSIGKWQNHNICEDEYAYDVCLRLARLLIQHDATVYIITRDPNDGIRDDAYLRCDKDERCYPDKVIPLNQKERLGQRTDAINELYQKHKKQGVISQKLVIIHVDSQGKSEEEDVFFYYKPDDKVGEKVARYMRAVLEKNYDRKYDGKVKSRELYQLMNSEPTSVFIELGNIQNPANQKRLTAKENRQTLAEWFFEGITH